MHKTRQQEQRSRAPEFHNLFLKSCWVWCHISKSLPPPTTEKQLCSEPDGSYGRAPGLCKTSTPPANRGRQTQAHAAASSSCPKPQSHTGVTPRQQGRHMAAAANNPTDLLNTRTLFLSRFKKCWNLDHTLKIHAGLGFLSNFGHNLSLGLSTVVVSRITPPTHRFSCSRSLSSQLQIPTTLIRSAVKKWLLGCIRSYSVSSWITSWSFRPLPQGSTTLSSARTWPPPSAVWAFPKSHTQKKCWRKTGSATRWPPRSFMVS